MHRPPFQDFEYFKNALSYLFKPKDKFEVSEGSLTLDEEYEKTFPNLYSLVSTARVTNVNFKGDNYKLLAWTLPDDESCGWFCKMEDLTKNNITLLPEHELLLKNIGGIKESYNEPDGSFTNNQNFLFIKSLCIPGLGMSIDHYEESCSYENIKPMPLNDLVTFVEEANGNSTLYNLQTKQVYLYSHDHAFDNVTTVPGQPEYTFHYIDGVTSFVDYVEILAKQWKEHLAAD